MLHLEKPKYSMIKFFRKIRGKSLSEGKTGEYLKYAIGEIVLVMIGILLALQVNNWNENRKAYNNSKNYLFEIVTDLQKDTSHFNYGIGVLNKLMADEEWVLNTVDYTEKDIDRLWDCLSGWYMDYRINSRTFQKIQNQGSSKLVGVDNISEKINAYYTSINSRTKMMTAWDIKDVTERHSLLRDLEQTIETSNYRMQAFGAGQVTKSFPMRQDSTANAELIIGFANSTRARNHYKNNYVRHTRVRNWFIEVVSESTKLMEEIEQELEE